MHAFLLATFAPTHLFTPLCCSGAHAFTYIGSGQLDRQQAGMVLQPSKLVLYNQVVSNCCARVRIAASLKNIPLEIVKSPKGKQNPSPIGTAPLLEAHYRNGEPLVMTQSLSMLEFLEEAYPSETRLLPPVTDQAARSKVMDLALLVACDFQPLLSSRVLNTLLFFSSNKATDQPGAMHRKQTRQFQDQLGEAHRRKMRTQYTNMVQSRAMRAYEGIAKQSAGKFSVGDNVSIADVCIVPMIQEMRRHGLYQQKSHPTIFRIVKTCEEIDAFRLQGVPPRSDRRGTSKRGQTDEIPQADQSTVTAASS